MTRNDWNDEERAKVVGHYICYGIDKREQLSEVIERHSTDSIKLELLRLHNYINSNRMEIISATNVCDRAATIKKYKAIFERIGIWLIKL
jgi:hypothetical protein